MKKLIKDILFITIMASAIAIAYNLFSPKPLPWIYKEKVIPLVHDTELAKLTDTENKKQIDITASVDTVTVKKDEIHTDTLVNEKKSSSDEKLIVKNETIQEKEQEQIQSTDKQNGLKTLNYKQVLKIIDNPKFLLIDARHKEEWEEEHIGNAINITPPYEGNTDSYFKKLMSLPNGKIIVVYCTGGSCDASHKVASDLIAIGYKRVYLYAGGWDDWTKKRRGK